jgi:hypothetical protein
MTPLNIDDRASIDEQKKQNIIESRIEFSEHIIPFRDDRIRQHKRKSWKVPLELLQFRKNNSRIRAEVLTYEKSLGTIDQDTEDGQKILGDFLTKSDPERMEDLKQLLKVNGQEMPAVATADGLLLNGNRRFKALQELDGSQFDYMEVVILPTGNADDGYDEGPSPTHREIQNLEHDYQIARTGHSKYTGVNKALWYRQNIDDGYTVKELLQRDPLMQGKTETELVREVGKVKRDIIETLEEFDNYLTYFGRENIYKDSEQGGAISDDRWQAFIDWTKVYRKLKDPSKHAEMNIRQEEIFIIRRAAFKLIRQKNIGDAGKPHEMMRKITTRILPDSEMKKKWLKIGDETKIPSKLKPEEEIDDEGNPKSAKVIDTEWSQNHGQHVVNLAKKIKRDLTHVEETNKPITLLEAAIGKVNHPDLNPRGISIEDNDTCMELCEMLIERAQELYDDFDSNRMNLDELVNKYNS